MSIDAKPGDYIALIQRIEAHPTDPDITIIGTWVRDDLPHGVYVSVIGTCLAYLANSTGRTIVEIADYIGHDIQNQIKSGEATPREHSTNDRLNQLGEN